MRQSFNCTFGKKRLHAGYLRLRCIMLIFIIAAVALQLTGCSQNVPDNAERISRPNNFEIPVSGTWIIEKCLSNEVSEISGDNDPLLGQKVGFSRDTVIFAGQVYRDISYKIKRVNVYEYFLHKNTSMPQKLSNNSNEIQVINVYSSDSFLLEFIKDSAGNIIAVADDRYYCLKKLSDELNNVQDAIEEATEKSGLDESIAVEEPLRSGILLGVRIPEKTEDGLGDYKYGTYWISVEDYTLRPVLYAENIYLPRMDGFWKLMVDKKAGPLGTEDSLIAFKVTNAEKKQRQPSDENVSKMETRLRKAIVYVGNDYVCVENIVYGHGKDTRNQDNIVERTLRTLPVDNLSSIDGIKISDLAGDNGTMAMESAIAELMKNSGYEGIGIINDDEQQKNFALYRKTGHWFFKGRIDPDRDGQLPYMDFNLNLLPPANMVAYDVLHVPWTEMKDKLPNAHDIYTSPNKDLAIVLTGNDILLYAIKGKELAEEPMARIRMEEGSTVVMAEWSMDEYVNNWQKSFTKNNEYMTVVNELADTDESGITAAAGTAGSSAGAAASADELR